MSCPFRKEPLFMSSRRTTMAGMRALWMEWLGSSPGITSSPSCITQSEAQHRCASSQSQVFPDELEALGISSQWNKWSIQMMKLFLFFYVLVHPLVLKTKKSNLSLNKWIFLLLFARHCLDWKCDHFSFCGRHNNMNVELKQIRPRLAWEKSGLFLRNTVHPWISLPAESVTLDIHCLSLGVSLMAQWTPVPLTFFHAKRKELVFRYHI